jgi:hypothetical protein
MTEGERKRGGEERKKRGKEGRGQEKFKQVGKFDDIKE